MAAEYLDHPRPLAFAHRGGAARQPENTLPAFDHAARLGYAYLETDARSTADGKLIAFHDARLTRATDRSGQVSKLPWREVSAARVGGVEPIPLLEDVLGTFPDLRFNIDLKDAGTVGPLAGVLRRTGAWDRVCITSFSAGRLITAQRSLDRPVCLSITPAAFVALRYLGQSARALARGLVRSGALCAQVPPQIATRDFIGRAHQLGLQVHVWTLNTRAGIAAALDLGADGVMTDEVELLRDILTERGQWHPRVLTRPSETSRTPVNCLAGPDGRKHRAGWGCREVTGGNTPETGLDICAGGNLVRVSSVAERDRQPPGRQ